MAELKEARALELDEDFRTQQWEWRVSIVTWILLILVITATLLGLFGGGPLSDAHAGETGGPLWVEYARFARFGASTRLVVHARPDAGGITRFTLSRALLDANRITHITPEPVNIRIVEDGVEYWFQAEPQSGAVPLVIELQPARRWIVRGAVRSPDQTLQFRQFIYP